MKKRILSFLLVLCMLVAMVPVTAAVAEENGSTESQADVVYAENYLDLYVTEGLTVLFDANSLSGDMITFGEEPNTTGTWYGYTVDAATGKLVKNESYVARPHGGAYNEETNPFGWQKLEGGGIAWDEPNSKTANYYLHFTDSWVNTKTAFEVELVYEPYLRDTTEGAICPETVVEYIDDKASQWYVDENGAPISGVTAGLLYDDREVVEKDVTTGMASLFKRTTKWQTGDPLVNNGTSITVYLSGGKAGETITLKCNYGTYTANADVKAGYTITKDSGKDFGTVTFDEEGCAVISAPIYGDFFEIIMPIETSAMIDKVEANVYLNQFAYDQTFVIGNLYGMVWSNKQASNTYSNGFGMARWSLAKASWEGNPAANYNNAATKAYMLDLSILDDKNYGKIDDKIVTMNVANTGSQYHLSYGNASKTFTLDPAKKNAEGKYDGQNFKALQQMGGAVYGMRLYNAPLTTAQKNQNHFADVAARYGLDVSTMELGNLSAYNYLFHEFASVALEGEDADELQAMLDQLIDENPAKLLNDYDKLYVQKGLVGLYSAFETVSAEGDDSLTIQDGKVTGWIDKINGYHATVTGNFVANYDGDGGFGIAPQTYAEWSANHKFGVTFPSDYADLTSFTVENVVRYRTNTTNHATSTDSQFDGSAVAIRYDVIAGLVWNNSANPASGKAGRFHVRTMLTNVGWGAMNCDGTKSFRINGTTASYCGNGYNLPADKLVTHSFYKDNNGTNVFFRIALDDTTVSVDGVGLATGSITVAQYNTIRAVSGATTGKFSTLNGTSGTLYAVRVYDRALNTAEVQQNKVVDILAHANYDLTKINFEDILANGPLVEALVNGGVGQSAAQIDDTIAFYIQDTTVEKNAYDKLYVDGGHLVALYSAYESDSAEGDSSLMVAGGKVIGWVDKVNQTIATVTGSFTANSNGDGGFGTDRWTGAQWDSETASSGVLFNSNYVGTDDFTVEAAIVLNSLSDRSGTAYNGARTQLRIDLLALTTFIGNSGSNNHQIRGVFSYGDWSSNGNHNGNGDVIGFGGQTTGYRADTYDFANGKINSMVFVKDTNADTSIKLVFDINGSRRANTTISAAQYAQQKSYRQPTDGLFSLLNGTPGDLYAVRVYDVALTTAQQRQNKLVDLLAYVEADLTNYPTEATEIALLANLIADKGWSFGTADLKTKLEVAMEIGVTTVTYKNVLTGETLKSFAEIKGEPLTLPESFGNKVVVEWDVNEDDAVASENVVYNAVVIEKPTANNGVSVRVDGEDVGLRFTTVLDKASYGDLTIKYGAENMKLGMLVSTSDIVTKAGAFTKDAIDLYAAGQAGYVDIAINGYYKMTEGGDYELAGVLTNIKDSSLDAAKVKFVSVLYIEIDTDADDVYDVIVYGSASAAKSVKDVADATKTAIDAADVDSGLTAEAEATFNTWYAAKFPTAE